MANNFRLHEVSIAIEGTEDYSNFLTPTQGRQNIEFTVPQNSDLDASWVTVLLGKNGVGKSRFLGSIANIFHSIDNDKPRYRRGQSWIKLKYSCNSQIVELSANNLSEFKSRVNGRPPKHQEELPLPTKVVALTTTPFDKFRITSWRDQVVMPNTSRRYEYLGLRDKTGRASSIAAIGRAVLGLFNAPTRDPERLNRIAEVFKFLGYKPKIEVDYEIGKNALETLRKIAEGSIDQVKDAALSLLVSDQAWKLSDPEQLAILKDTCSVALSRLHDRYSLRISADFESQYDDRQLFSLLYPLINSRTLAMRSVIVERLRDGARIDLRHASSGELGIVIGFLNLASVIEDGSLVLIDEPEISLHPEWQAGYIELLLKTFGAYKGCHYIVATHSPLILSDINPEVSNVVMLDTEKIDGLAATEIAGKSSDHLLATTFQTPGNNNLYLKQEIVKALRLAAKGETDSVEFTDLVDWMVTLLPKLGEDSSVAQIIRDLKAAAIASEGAE